MGFRLTPAHKPRVPAWVSAHPSRRSKVTPATLTAPAVHVSKPHPSQQHARQGDGDELHPVECGSDLFAVVSVCLVKLRPILQRPELLLEDLSGVSQALVQRWGSHREERHLLTPDDHMEHSFPHLSWVV